MHSDLKAAAISANTEWASQQTRGIKISVAHRKIVAKYRYNHTHDMDSIKEILKILAVVDEAQDCIKVKAPGMIRLQQLVQHPLERRQSLSKSSDKSVNAATTTNSKVSLVRRGREKKEEHRPRLAKYVRCRAQRSPSTS